jgi:hypothetical protein
LNHINLPKYRVKPFIQRPDVRFPEFDQKLRELGDFRLVYGGEETQWWAGFTVMHYPFARTMVESLDILIGYVVDGDHVDLQEYRARFGRAEGRTDEPLYLQLPRDERDWSEEHRAKYRIGYPFTVRQEIYEAGAPYWYIEKLLPAGVACIGWEEDRLYWQPGYMTDRGDGYVDLLGERPSEGAWLELFKLTDEHGRPRDPASSDLDRVRQYIHDLLAEPDLKGWRHDDQTPAAVVEKRAADKRALLEEQDERELRERTEIYKNRLNFRLFGGTPRSFAKGIPDVSE